MNDDLTPSFSLSRKWSQRINVLVGIVSLFAIVAMCNYVASRHFKRFHLQGGQRTRLSPLSLRLLASLTNEVKVICYLAHDESLYGDIRELLAEYKAASPKFVVEMIDPRRDVGAAEHVKAIHALPPNESAFLLFENQGRTKLIRKGDLFEYDLQPLVSGQTREVKPKDFKGELIFTSAIYYLTSQRSLKAYFLTGHGGPSPRDQEARRGLSRLAGLLQMNGIEWAELELLDRQSVPEDCGLLIIAGPRQRLPDSTIDTIGRYLDNGGRALALFDVFGKDIETGLESLLKRYGVSVGMDTVKDPQSLSMAGGQDVVISAFGPHPITKALRASGTTRLQLLLPRSIQPIAKAGGATDLILAESLFTTGPMGTSYETTGGAGGALKARASALRTNYPLAVAVERGSVPGVEAARAGTSRLVVVGDSLFLSNELIDSSANAQFASYSVNWLLDRALLLAEIGPQPYREYRLRLTESERGVLTWVLLGGMPGAVLGLGFLVWLRRRV
ncbi:MAG: GldG family protein [Verrucomicrobia bacterium]|nr:GldG family protein [Verrucomicrobiota bacterium]MBI3871219.1 GldG family protein [Verrucomicrobiota bacterium]